ncbi:hypothetical protein GL50803_0021531 [Giardia duodenalis]|uniref:Uncharacterized protein n=1 Tax=Giardia intestinalis (strain ATCC 50803 / WB clone C6) TaxID=184922 RepID=A8BQ91_GIAIC|nr:hypothetical protein GL50803_0021531 [Giardia intestinalis]KAE8304131.1 hypothetical protein GL50803_0021531 [Giardia intestinalis]|eukprot:XP_001705609.1 Hypothetical protein GL50803_21531 [Giardia lamblia ATCC 50803]
MAVATVDLPMPRSRLFGMKRTTETAHRPMKRLESQLWQPLRLATPYDIIRTPSLQLIPPSYRNKARNRSSDLLFSLNDIECILTEIRDQLARETAVEFERIYHARISENEARVREYISSLLNEQGQPVSYIQ